MSESDSSVRINHLRTDISGDGSVGLACEVRAATESGLGAGLEGLLRGLSSFAASREALMEVEVRRVAGVRSCDPGLVATVMETVEERGLAVREEVLYGEAPAADLWVCEVVGEILAERGWELRGAP